ncbi:hypothetical protein SCA6_001948 [Theobroma cacao]
MPSISFHQTSRGEGKEREWLGAVGIGSILGQPFWVYVTKTSDEDAEAFHPQLDSNTSIKLVSSIVMQAYGSCLFCRWPIYLKDSKRLRRNRKDLRELYGCCTGSEIHAN